MELTTSLLSTHDLRHQMALLACDLGNTLARIEAGESELARAYVSVLARLDAGLERTLALLAGRAQDLAPPAATGGQEDLVREIWDSFLRAARLRPANSELRIAGGPLHFGRADLLHSLVLNLLSNACAAAPEGPVELELSGRSIRLRNGGGALPPELGAMLARGEAPRAEGARGQGLGLILAAAEGLGLNLSVHSEEGNTVFSFQPLPESGPRVLMVEDDPGLREMMREFLRHAGFSVEAQERAEGLDVLPGRYVAVLADLNLPGLDGDLFLSRWKRGDPAAFCVLLTGDSRLAARDWPGIDEVVIKPGLTRLLELLAPLRTADSEVSP